MAEFIPEFLKAEIESNRCKSIKIEDFLNQIDGQGAIITDEDLLKGALGELRMTLDTWLMPVPDELYCLVFRRGIYIHSCSMYNSKRKAEEGFVKFMREGGYFEKAAEYLNGEHEHDYKLMLEAIDTSDFWKVDFQAIQEIE